MSFTFDPPLVARASPTQVWELPAFLRVGIPFLPPNHEMRSILGVSFDFFAEGGPIPLEYQADINYTDSTTQRELTDSYRLDLGIFRDTRTGSATTLREIHDVLKEQRDHHGTMANRVGEIGDLLAEGILVANDSLLVEAGSGALNGDDRLEATIAEIGTVCASWRYEDENLRWRTADSLTRRLRILRGQLHRLVVESQSEELRSTAQMIDRNISQLADHRFFLNGGVSYRSYEAIVDRLIVAVQGAPG